MSAPRVLFTGITGLLGGYFLKNSSKKFEVIGIYSKSVPGDNSNFFKVDISNRKEVFDFVKKTRPNVIVHAASIGNVDYCESHPKEAKAVNIKGTQNVVDAAEKVRANIIFTSSNAIYNGINHPFDEKSKPNPIDFYGKTKVEGENIILKSKLRYSILRLMTMYGWHQPGGRINPAVWVIEKLKNKEEINIVNDIYNNHLWAGQAAQTIWKIITGNNYETIYNVAGKDSVNRYDFALKVAKVFHLNASLITPVTSDFFKNIAVRPKNTSFNTTKMQKELKIKPISILKGLKFMKKERND